MGELKVPAFEPPTEGPRRLDWASLPEAARKRMVETLRAAGEQAMSAEAPGPQVDLGKLRAALRRLRDTADELNHRAIQESKSNPADPHGIRLFRSLMSEVVIEVGKMPLTDPMGPLRLVPHDVTFYVAMAPGRGMVGKALPGHGYIYYIDYDLLQDVPEHKHGLSHKELEAWKTFVLQNMAHELMHLVQASLYPALFSDYPGKEDTGSEAYRAHPAEREARWAGIDAMLRMHGPTQDFWALVRDWFGDDLRQRKDDILKLIRQYKNRILGMADSLMTADAIARKLGLTEKAMKAFMKLMEPHEGGLETVAQTVAQAPRARWRVLMLVSPREFYEPEYSAPRKVFAERGMMVSVATDGRKAVGAHGTTIETDLDVAQADAGDFDALFVVGGKGMVEFSDNRAAQKLLREFVAADKPVAMVCHAPLLAAKAGLAAGRQMTGWPEIRQEMAAAGAEWTGMPVERDGDMFTAVGPEDAEPLADILARRMDGAPSLSEAVLDEAAGMRKLARLWRAADTIGDRPMTDEEAARWLREFEREEFEEAEPEVAATPVPAPPPPTPVPAPPPPKGPEPAIRISDPERRGGQPVLKPRHEWNIAIELRPPRTDGTWPEVPEAPPPGFPFPADDLRDGPSVRALFQKPETWVALKEMASNPAKRGLIQSYLLPALVLVLGKSWWNIHKRRRQLGNAPFGLFSSDEYKAIQDRNVALEDTVAGQAFIALINWHVARIVQYHLATGTPGPGERFDGYVYGALNTRMVESAGKRHGFEQRKPPACAYCRFKRVIRTTPPLLSQTRIHEVGGEGVSHTRPIYKCPTCEDLIGTKEQELRLKEQGVRNAEESLREMAEHVRDGYDRLAKDPGDAELRARTESRLSMWRTYGPQVEALAKERDDLRSEIGNRRNMLDVPYSHIACIREDCPGVTIPLTFVDWESGFWRTPEGGDARRKLANFYGIAESPAQAAEDAAPAGGDPPPVGKAKVPPEWMWDIPFHCPFDHARFTPRGAFGHGKPTAAGRRLGGLFVDPPRDTVWWKPMPSERMPEDEAEQQRVEETRTQTGIDTTTDSNRFLADQNEKMYYQELADALRQEFYRRREAHTGRTGGLDGNRTAKLEALLYEAVLEWSFVHPLHLVGYFTKRMPSVRRVIDKGTGEVRKHLEIRSLGRGGAEQIVSSLIQTWFAKALERPDGWRLLQPYLASEPVDKVPPRGYFVSVVRRGADGELEAPCGLRYAKGSPIGDKPPRGSSYQRDIYLALVEGIWDYPGTPKAMDTMAPVPPERGDMLARGMASRLDEMDHHNSQRIVFDSATSLVEGSPILVKALFMPRHTAWIPVKRVMHLRKDLADPEDDMAGIMDVVGRLADNREEDVRMFARWRKALSQLGMPEKVKEFDEALRRRMGEKGMGREASLLLEAKDPLAGYRAKREFDETPEPEGKGERGRNRHRFVIQRHFARKAGQHFDLRLENDDGTLSSWSIPKHRLPEGKEKLLAVKTEDHPVEYLGFKGEIPSGYGAGTMGIHDSGTYEEIEWGETKIAFRLKGKREKGTYRLFRAGRGGNWLIMEGIGKGAAAAFPFSRRADEPVWRGHHRFVPKGTRTTEPGEWRSYRLPAGAGTPIPPKSEEEIWREHERKREEKEHKGEAPKLRTEIPPLRPKVVIHDMPHRWWLLTLGPAALAWYRDPKDASEAKDEIIYQFSSMGTGPLASWMGKLLAGLGAMPERMRDLMISATSKMRDVRDLVGQELVVVSPSAGRAPEWQPPEGTILGEGELPFPYGAFDTAIKRDLPNDVLGWHEKGLAIINNIADYVGGRIADPMDILKTGAVLPPLSKLAKEKRGGAMLALMAPPAIARRMRKAKMVEDKDLSGTLHMTLLYLGKAADLGKEALEAIRRAAERVCARHEPLEMSVSGAGTFTPGKDGTPVYVVPNAKGLSALQADLENAVGSIVDLPSGHGWVPHMTVCYSCDDKPELPDLSEKLEWIADKVRLQVGGEKVADIPIGRKKRGGGEPPLSKRATEKSCWEYLQIFLGEEGYDDWVRKQKKPLEEERCEEALDEITKRLVDRYFEAKERVEEVDAETAKLRERTDIDHDEIISKIIETENRTHYYIWKHRMENSAWDLQRIGVRVGSMSMSLSKRADKVSRKVKPLFREPIPEMRMWEGIWEKYEDPVKHMREDRPHVVLPQNIPDWAVAAEGLERLQDLPSGEGLEPSDPDGRYYVTDMDDNIVARYATREKAIRNAEASRWTAKVFHSAHADPWDVFVHMDEGDKPVVWERPPEQARKMKAELRAKRGPYYLVDYWGRVLVSYNDLDQAVRNAEGSMYVSHIVFSMVDDPDRGKVVWTKPELATVQSSGTPPLSKRAGLERLPIAADPAMWTDGQLVEAVARPELFGDDKGRYQAAVGQLAKRGLAGKVDPKDVGHWLERGSFLLFWGGSPLAVYRTREHAERSRNTLVGDFAEQAKFPDFVDGGQRGWESLIAGDVAYHAERTVGEHPIAFPMAKRQLAERLLNPKANAKDRKAYAESALNIVGLPATLDIPEGDYAGGDRPDAKDSVAASGIFAGTLRAEPDGEDDPSDEDAGDISAESRHSERVGRDEFIDRAVTTVRKRLDAQRAGLDPEKLADDDELEVVPVEPEQMADDHPCSKRTETYQ